VKSGDRLATASAPADTCAGAAAFSGHDSDGCSAQSTGSSPQSSGSVGSVGVPGSDMIGKTPGVSSLCAAMTSLGLTGLLPCDAMSINLVNDLGNAANRQLGGASAGGPTGIGDLGNAANRQLGGASAGGPTGIGTGGSTGATPSGPAASGSASAGSGGVSGQGAATGPASTRFNASCASHTHADGGGTSPSTTETAGLLGALAIAGLSFRRNRRPRLA
jgi:MYXO-CTERM domain-containing protein